MLGDNGQGRIPLPLGFCWFIRIMIVPVVPDVGAKRDLAFTAHFPPHTARTASEPGAKTVRKQAEDSSQNPTSPHPRPLFPEERG